MINCINCHRNLPEIPGSVPPSNKTELSEQWCRVSHVCIMSVNHLVLHSGPVGDISRTEVATDHAHMVWEDDSLWEMDDIPRCVCLECEMMRRAT